jgi:photosystem II stability/assembly factor-like uncharacterized protein
MKYSLSNALAALPLAGLLLLGQGCVGSSKTAAGPDGGLFVNLAGTQTWTQLKVLNAGMKQGSIANIASVSYAQDPQDTNAIYVGTVQDGLLYSLDAGASWQKSPELNTGRINAVAVHPKNKCLVLATRANAIWKTENCLRDWSQIYFHPSLNVSFTALAIDATNPNIWYAGDTDGDILRSANAGASWSVLKRVPNTRINAIVLSPADSRALYVATHAGLWKTTDAGVTWEQEKSGEGGALVQNVLLDPGSPATVYQLLSKSLLTSDPTTSTWRTLALPTPVGSVTIRAFAIDPKNSQHLVYATDASIVTSVDGGNTWSSKKLPTTRGASFLFFDQGSTPNLYLGTRAAN